MIHRMAGVGLGALAGVLLLVGSAWAAGGDTSFAAGPVTVPNAPLSVCVGTTCATTPAVVSVALSLDSAGPASAPTAAPALVAAACPTGTVGVGAQAGGLATGTVTGTLTVVGADGTRTALPIQQDVSPTTPLKLTACTVS
jgi:hypothetical protein